MTTLLIVLLSIFEVSNKHSNLTFSDPVYRFAFLSRIFKTHLRMSSEIVDTKKLQRMMSSYTKEKKATGKTSYLYLF